MPDSRKALLAISCISPECLVITYNTMPSLGVGVGVVGLGVVGVVVGLVLVRRK
ncbi:MAG: hypothetical protein QW772_03790 [Zestosphaera sp.]